MKIHETINQYLAEPLELDDMGTHKKEVTSKANEWSRRIGYRKHLVQVKK